MIRSLFACSVAGLCFATFAHSQAATTTPTTVPVTITGGHDTDPRDRGRPVTLIAHALGVTDQQFRDAFSKVHPAQGNGGPTPDEARANKQALMDALAPLGVTNDRLDEVSNYYRYRREEGQVWRQTPAGAYATVANGKVTGVVVTSAGAGYSSQPTVSVPSMADVALTATLGFGTDLATNGRVESIALNAQRR